MILKGAVRGYIGADAFFGLTVAGRDGLNQKTPVTIDGSTNLLSSEQLAIVFNGAVNGDFLRLTTKTDINGKDVFVVGSTPLDVIEYTESFTFSGADTVLTANYQTLISGVTINEYRSGTSQAITSFRIFNDDKQLSADVEFYVTVNGAVPLPDDLQVVTVAKDNGVVTVSFDDTVQTTVNPTDTVTVHARQLTGDFGEVTVQSSTYSTTLDMVQNAAIQNLIQSTTNINTSKALSERKYYRIETNGIFSIPEASTKFSQSVPFGFTVKNLTGGSIVLNASPGDVIKTTDGDSLAYDMVSGASASFICAGPNSYDVIGTYEGVKADTISSLDNAQTNNDYDSSPQTKLSAMASFGYSAAKVSFSFEAKSSSTNRSVVVGLFVNGNLIDDEFETEMKDFRNNPYPCKIFPLSLSPGNNLFEVKFGKRNGGGGNPVSLKNVRIIVEPI